MSIKIETELHTKDFPEVFAAFSSLIGSTPWVGRVKKLRAEIRKHRHLKEYLRGQNQILFSLARFSEFVKRRRPIPRSELNNRDHYAAMGVAMQCTSLLKSTSGGARRVCRNRVRRAIDDSEEMRALRVELLAATHFSKQGIEVKWPELDGSGQCDLLLPSLGPLGLQVECKAMSRDKGHKIHTREALDFRQWVFDGLNIHALRGGLAVVVSVEDRIPENAHALAQRVARQITQRESSLFEGHRIDVSEFKLSEFVAGDEDQIRQEIERITGTSNRQSAFIFNDRGTAAVALVLKSQKDDTITRAFSHTLGRSAKSQIRDDQAAMYLVGLDGLSASDLAEIADSDEGDGVPSVLAVAVTKFFDESTSDNMVGAIFLSESSLDPRVFGLSQDAGRSYFFANDSCALWDDDYRVLLSSA